MPNARIKSMRGQCRRICKKIEPDMELTGRVTDGYIMDALGKLYDVEDADVNGVYKEKDVIESFMTGPDGKYKLRIKKKIYQTCI